MGIGIGDCDWRLGLVIEIGIEIKIGDRKLGIGIQDWGLELHIWIGNLDWELEFGIGLGNGIGDWD